MRDGGARNFEKRLPPVLVLAGAMLLAAATVSPAAARAVSGRNDDAGAPARVRQFGVRAVGGGWRPGVAERLDALGSHVRVAARLRAQRRAVEPFYTHTPVPPPLVGADRVGVRR